MTFHEFLHRHAARRSDNYALRTVDGSITYSELEDSVNRTAAHLLNLGLRRGDRIAIYWSNSLETVQLLLAAFRAGLIAVPINVRLKAPEIACILEHSGAKVCFSETAVDRHRKTGAA